MKIAITGGSGFIGTRLRALLEEAGHECVIIDLKHETPVDILDLPALTKALSGCAAVYHLAAEHRDDVFPRSRYYAVNVTGMENLCKAMDANGIDRIVFTSSFAVYGLDAGAPDENAPPAPFNDYGQSKLEGENVLREWAARNGAASATIIRPVVVFGEGNRGNVHTLIRQIASGKFVMVGNGRNRKSMAYVGNVAAFLHHCLAAPGGLAVYNYADKPDFSMNEFVAVICSRLGRAAPRLSLPRFAGLGAGYLFDAAARITGRTFPISAVRVEKFCAETTSDAAKAHGIFKAPYALEEGLGRFVQSDFLKTPQGGATDNNADADFLPRAASHEQG
ncbi:MAG: NAD-dependent epimerase/dehydratase family protein [Micavibrio sp.]